MIHTAKAPSARSKSAMFTRLRMRFGIPAALVAVLALALPALAPADPLGSVTLFKSGLRTSPLIVMDTVGPDGNVWFVDSKIFGEVPAIGRITPSGTITEYVSGAKAAPKLSGLNPGSDPIAIAAGPGGEKYLWFTDKGATPAIGRIDSASPETAVEEFSTVLNPGSKPQGIVAAPDGNLWFTDTGTTPAIGKVNPSTGAIEEFSAGLNPGSKPRGITVGPDGNLWFTDVGTTQAIGKFNLTTHVTEAEFPTGASSQPGGATSEFGPWGIAPGPDGNVWFTENGSTKAIGRITPSGTITNFSAGLIASSHPGGLTAAPDGNLWFTDESAVKEKQELVIEDAGTLGGTYKLGFEGKETGATGSGNLLSKGTGKGDVKRFPPTGNATCKRTAESNELKECNNEPAVKAEVGMRITGTGIPVETTITNISGKTITISNPATTGAETNSTNINAGWIINVTTETGAFEAGQTISGTGIATSAILKVGASTITPATPPTAVGTAVSLTGKATTVVTGVTTTTGAFSVGEEISGTGIPAGTTISAINANTKSLTLSKEPTSAGTGVELSADLRFDAPAIVIQEALEKLPGIGAGNVEVGGSGATSPIKRTFTFTEALGGTDVEQLSCNGTGLTGTGPTCAVTTTVASVPAAIGRITPSGPITRYPVNGLPGVTGITSGPGGNLWFPTGVRGFQKIGKFGIEYNTELKVKTTGTGTGTVTSSPAGINCSSECSAEFEAGKKVKLEATADPGSVFIEWSGACSGAGACEVTMNEDREVTAEFDEAYALTVTKTGAGTGTVESSPAGINCGSECSAEYEEGTEVTLTQSAGSESEFREWGGACSGTGACEVTMSEAKSVTARFSNERPVLTVTKSGPANSAGTVKSKPKGVNCAAACSSAKARFYKGTPVTLEAKPATGSTFVEWTGACSGAGTCTVTMSAAKSVNAVFGGASKEIVNAKALTFTKAPGTGQGTVKATGLACEAACTEAVVNYTGGVGGPKPKPAAKALLTAVAVPGSEFSGWSGSGCSGTGTCEVEMSEAHSVSAQFTAKPSELLTVTKSGTTNSAGTVKSKPKGVNCAAACSSAKAQFSQGTLVTLEAKPALGSTFVEWTGACSGAGTCTVTMSAAKSVNAVFGGASKEIVNAKALTFKKAGTGYGTVKATGLACEAACTEAVVNYTGGVGGPKPKPAAKAILTPTAQVGSEFVEWGGACSGSGACEVEMSSAKEVTARFEE